MLGSRMLWIRFSIIISGPQIGWRQIKTTDSWRFVTWNLTAFPSLALACLAWLIHKYTNDLFKKHFITRLFCYLWWDSLHISIKGMCWEARQGVRCGLSASYYSDLYPAITTTLFTLSQWGLWYQTVRQSHLSDSYQAGKYFLNKHGRTKEETLKQTKPGWQSRISVTV